MIDYEGFRRLVGISFRKLKASVYFDKTQNVLRDKLVEFEVDNIEEKLDAIANYCYNGASGGFLEDVARSINVLVFPKKLKGGTCANPDGSGSDRIIGLNDIDRAAVVNEMQYFIDLSVEGHIIGVLWCLLVGINVDSEFCPNSKGNRLRQLLLDEFSENETVEDHDFKDSPVLFAPYFQQYTSWRDEALNVAKEKLQDHQDAVIITLDLKGFYYSVDIDETLFGKIVDNDADDVVKRIHSAVFKIIKVYTKKLSSLKEGLVKGQTILPIGFLPSGILSNWALSKFDKGVLDYWNPLYYGRYVDDIIIVDKAEEGSWIAEQFRLGLLKSSNVIQYYMMGGRRDAPNLANFIEAASSSLEHENFDCRDSGSSNAQVEYRIDSAFCMTPHTVFKFNRKKTKVMYLSHKNDSESIISIFKKQIIDSTSEMRLMPDIADGMRHSYYGQLYWLDNEETINKLNGIRDISIDRFELSKYLGRYRVISGLITDDEIKKFTESLFKVFGSEELIELYIYWERILEIFATDGTDGNILGLSKFIKRTISAIENTEVELSNNSDISIDRRKELSGNNQKKMVGSLKKYLRSACNRTLSLIWGDSIRKLLEDDVVESLRITLRASYLKTRLSNKYVTQMPLSLCSRYSYDDSKDVNLTRMDSFIKFVGKNVCEEEYSYKFLPYFEKAQDESIEIFFTRLIHGKVPSGDGDTSEASTNPSEEHLRGRENADWLEYKPEDGSGFSQIYIRKENTNKGSMKVALANVRVDEGRLVNFLKNKKLDRSMERYKDFVSVFNTALKEGADMLVFPECYLPKEWLINLANKAANEQIAVVTGIEHFAIGDVVYNVSAIILPFVYNTIPESAIFFQIKKHYSPEEKRLIEGYGKKVPDEKAFKDHILYHWNGCYFPVFCCYELTSIQDRSVFMSYADLVVAIELNRDTNYFGSIVESMVRDLHCYCIQVNTSQYGDSRIVQPKKTEERDLVKVKGGANATVLIDEISLSKLREFQIQSFELQQDKKIQGEHGFKPTPIGIDLDIVRKKMSGETLL